LVFAVDELVSVEHDRVALLLGDADTVTISSANLPASCAAAAFCWLARASASCMSRVMLQALATFSAVMPMWYWL
jgi:hypothetical protein